MILSGLPPSFAFSLLVNTKKICSCVYFPLLQEITCYLFAFEYANQILPQFYFSTTIPEWYIFKLCSMWKQLLQFVDDLL